MSYEKRFRPRNDIRGLFGSKPSTESELTSAAREIEHDVYAKDYNTAERKKLASEGKALPNLSYPIDTVDDLKSAITLAQSGHGDVAAAKALIKRRAAALGRTDLIPDDWR